MQSSAGAILNPPLSSGSGGDGIDEPRESPAVNASQAAADRWIECVGDRLAAPMFVAAVVFLVVMYKAIRAAFSESVFPTLWWTLGGLAALYFVFLAEHCYCRAVCKFEIARGDSACFRHFV